VAALCWWLRRTRWSLVVTLVIATTAVLQACCILLTAPDTEGKARLGASAMSFLTLFAQRVVLTTLVGDVGNTWLGPLPGPAVIVVAALAIASFAAVVWKGPAELRLLLLYAGLILVASLAWPPASTYSDAGYWDMLAVPGNGNRYFLVPVFVTLTAIVWAVSSRRIPGRVLGGVALASVLGLGMPLDWREPPLRDYGFGQYVQKYERATPGQRVQIVTPPGWSFVLTKR
jgi:hypothetical protein